MSLIDDYKNGKRYGTDWQAPSFQHMNDLVGTVSNANDNANDALNKSTTAESNSSTALTKATTAENNSADAVSTANAANTKSDNANTKADNANTKSDNAVTTANNANTKATNAETIANNLTQAPDISEANKFGIANVEIIGTDTNKKFKFSNLKGNGIANIAKTGSDGLQDTYTITFNNGDIFSFNVANGKSITNISKTNTSGLVDTYTITYNDASTSIFTVTNGDSIELRVDSGYFQWKYTNSAEWLNLIAVGALSKIDDALSNTSTNAVQNKVITNAINNKLDKSGNCPTGTYEIDTDTLGVDIKVNNLNITSGTLKNDMLRLGYGMATLRSKYTDTDGTDKSMCAGVENDGFVVYKSTGSGSSTYFKVDKSTGKTYANQGLEVKGDLLSNGVSVATMENLTVTNALNLNSSSVAYIKLSGFGEFIYGDSYTLLLETRGSEAIVVKLSSDGSTWYAFANRIFNSYSKIQGLYYSLSEKALFVKVGAYCTFVNATVISNTNSIGTCNSEVSYSDTFVPSDAVEISIIQTIESGSNANGYYIKYSDGSLICYGNKSISNYSTTITYPMPFINTNYSLVTQFVRNNSVGNYSNSQGLNSITKTSCVCYSAYSETATILWFAIGKWK